MIKSLKFLSRYTKRSNKSPIELKSLNIRTIRSRPKLMRIMYFCLMQDDYSLLIRKLRAFVKKYYQNKLIRGLILCFSLVLVGFISLATLEYFGNFGPVIRAFLFWVFVAFSLFTFLFFVLSPSLKLFRLSKQLSDAEAAELIGRHFPEVDDRLKNVLQLKEQKTNNSALLEASIKQKAAALKPVPFLKAVNFFENKRYAKFLIAPVLVVCALYFSGREMVLTESSARIIDYQTEYIPPSPFEISIINETLEGIQHQDFLLRIKLVGNDIPTDAFIEINELDIKMRSLPNHTFEYRFRNLQKSQNFKIKVGELISNAFLSVLPSPRMVNFELSLDYPGYTGRVDERITNVGELTVPEGTWMRWDVVTENADSIGLVWGDQQMDTKPTMSNKFSLLRKAQKSLKYTFLPINKQITANDSVSYDLKVIKDAYPLVEVTETLDSTSLKTRYFSGSISDDYGLDKLQIVVKKQLQ